MNTFLIIVIVVVVSLSVRIFTKGLINIIENFF